MGAWYDYGESRYGEMAAQAGAIGEETGLAPSTVTTYASLYRRFGNVFQNLDGITIKHLQVVRTLDDQETAAQLLLEAQTQGKDSGELKADVEAVKPKKEPRQQDDTQPAEDGQERETVLMDCVMDMVDTIEKQGTPKWMKPCYERVVGKLAEIGISLNDD